ncbi:hypothetical protein FKP32DRAFT_1588058 [Trametes sanguinea]|nr:hypothetical protein FKP32DRAFT_1588058 [Trametes sanguinea]
MILKQQNNTSYARIWCRTAKKLLLRRTPRTVFMRLQSGSPPRFLASDVVLRRTILAHIWPKIGIQCSPPPWMHAAQIEKQLLILHSICITYATLSRLSSLQHTEEDRPTRAVDLVNSGRHGMWRRRNHIDWRV